MNFDKWYNSKLPRQPFNSYKREIKLGWDACKQEVLNIIKESTKDNSCGTSSEELFHSQKIEKLYKKISRL
jgi:hypothetical protein